MIRILLVEDDPDDVELLLEAFHDNNVVFNLEVVKEGNKVLPYLDLCKIFPDIIILDLNLPKMHGKEVLQRIKESRFAEIPVVILTTSSAKEDMDFCLNAGADRFISKPSTVKGFNETVRILIQVANIPTEKHS
jgi:CheY-like chemotaxis protein